MRSFDITPAEPVRQAEPASDTADLSWFWKAYGAAEAELNRPVMRLLTGTFAVLVAAFYVAFAAILMWKPGA